MSFAQQTGNSTQGVIGDPQTVVVTGSFEPIPLSEANRSVVSLNLLHEPLLYDSLIDALHSDSSIDLEERAPDGVQTDLSIRGATFEQSLVLVNGLRMNDAQSGHHDMDLPLPAEAVSRIEILHGAGSTLYGADAMGGAVNFITTPPVATEVRARVGLGNFGFNQEHAVASFLGSKWSERVAASRDSSSGFRPDRDYQSGAATSETYLKTGLGAIAHSEPISSMATIPLGSGQKHGSPLFGRRWERTPMLPLATAATRTNLFLSAMIQRFTKTTISAGAGKRTSVIDRAFGRIGNSSMGWRQMATRLTATISGIMRAIAEPVT
jgi:hypothetical protein